VIKLRPQHETKLQISREVRDFGELVREENSCDFRLLQKNSRGMMVGVERFTTGHYPTTILKLFYCNNIEL